MYKKWRTQYEYKKMLYTIHFNIINKNLNTHTNIYMQFNTLNGICTQTQKRKKYLK